MSTKHPPAFADLLRRFRIAAGLTQEELAERAGLSAKGISDLERGARTRPRRDTVSLVAEALGLNDSERELLATSGRKRTSEGATTFPIVQESAARAGAGRAPLVGRTAEVELLDRHLGGLATPVLMFAGEPGIGKTRLLEEASRRAVATGYTVLSGGCHRRSGQEPYEPLLAALEQHLAQLTKAERKHALRGCELLVRLLPELSEIIAVPDYATNLPPAQERRLLLAAIARYLAQAAGPTGTVLILDDLQWAGQDALDVIASLARATTSRSLRLVIAFRDTEVRAHESLAALCADLAREGLATRTLLSPLSPSDASALLEQTLSEESLSRRGVEHDAAALLQRAGGIPFYLMNLAQAIRSGLSGDRVDDLPWSVTETIRQRVRVLPAEAQTLLGVAAVAGRSVERRTLLAVARLTDMREADAVTALDATIAAKLLVPEGDIAYAFPHDLVRETVVADLGAARRGFWHRQLARVLEQSGEPAPAVLAYHYERGGDDEKARFYHESAGDRALGAYANADAAEHFRAAVTLLEHVGNTDDRARLSLKLGTALASLGAFDEALVVFERAADGYRQKGDQDGLARAIAQIGWVHSEQGTTDTGLSRLTSALRDFADGDATPGLAMLYVALARLYFIPGRYEQQVTAAEQAAAIAAQVGDQATLLRAQEQRARGLNMLGRIEEGARALADQVLPLAEVVGDKYTQVRALNSLGAAYGYWGEFIREQSYIERSLKLANSLGDAGDILFANFRLCLNAFEIGDWVAARRYLEQAEKIRSEAPSSRAAAHIPLARAELELAMGEVISGVRHAEEALASARQNHDFQLQAGVQSLLAEWELLSGHPVDAYDRVAPLVADSRGAGSFANTLLSLLAWSHLEREELADASRVLARALEQAASANMRRSWALALLVQGKLALHQGMRGEAESALQTSVELCQAMPCAYGEAKALLTLGEVYMRFDECERARDRLQAALTILDRLGERLYRPTVERAITAAHS